MANAARRWLPLGIVALVTAVTAFLVRDLPSPVAIDMRGLLPFPLEPEADTAPRWVAVVGIPLLATIVWISFQLGRSRAALRFTRDLFPGAPETLGDPATIERFRATYDIIVLWVVVLILGLHAGVVAAALGHASLAPTIVSVVMGMSLIAAGNVMPRLRPNVIAGVRTRRTLTDPKLWRETHRILGRALVIAGALTVVVGLLAPGFGLITAILSLIIGCVIASVAGARARRATAAAFSVLIVMLAARAAGAQQAQRFGAVPARPVAIDDAR